MFGLAEACVDHGVIAQTGVCCPGLTPWAYDANSGASYSGFGCWNATCAEAGQFSGPGAGKCCTGLVPVNGKCATPQTSGGSCATVGKVPTAGQVCCVGLAKDGQGICNAPANTPGTSVEWIAGIPNDYIIYGGLGLLALMMLGGKK